MKTKTSTLSQGHRYTWRNGKRIAEHRATMEDHLGHPLSRGEIVHHIDGDPLNNNIENLMVMTRADHLILHLRVMPIEPWTADEEETAIRLSREGRPIEHIAQNLGKGYYAVRRRLARARKHGRL
jgi:HNH endonuclease